MKKMKIAVVTARFNEEVTGQLREGALKVLKARTDVELQDVWVPGAVEIPLAAQAFLEKKFDGVVTLGAVIRGDTAHFDYVCQSVERGVTRLMLDYKKPIGFGVLTTENEEQAFERVGGAHGHKGEEAAQTVIEMIELLNKIQSL